MSVFVDTWAWLALADREDQYHAQATKEHARLQKLRRRYCTTNFVLSELITLLYRKKGAPQAQKFVSALLSSLQTGHYQMAEVNSHRFQRAWHMRQKYDDKPDISFVDFTSMVIMQDLGISEIFSGDAHFEHVGLGFRLLP